MSEDKHDSMKQLFVDSLIERIKILEDALKEVVRCAAVFKDNLLDSDVTLTEYCNSIPKAKQALQSKLK